ncbi:MAG: High-affnity carbon uptake protein Hat/HatR, partial [Bacteroidia bacterium]|nr:High-affnity carbon uptake protein Hat/HatR [Bacteroidia bacterium]
AEAARIRADISAAEAIAAQKIAEEQKALALIAEAKAVKNEKTAVEQTKRAEAESKRANEAAARALRQQYLSTAKGMALKSKELTNDVELESLIAQQAYLFNTAHVGYPYDNDVYNGLSKALTQNNDPLTLNLEGHDNGAARALVAHAKANHIYSGGSDGRIIQWSLVGNKWTPKELVPFRGSIYQVFAMDVSADGKWLAAGGLAAGNALQNYVELYDLQNVTAPPKKISGFSLNVDDIEFTPDNKGFYARDNAGRSIKYSDLSTAKEIFTTKMKITDIALSPDGSRLAGTGSNGVLYSWDLKNNYAIKEVFKNPSGAELTTLAYAPDGSRRIVVGDNNGLLRLVTEDASTPTRILSGHTAHIEQIRFNHSGKFLATTSRDRSVRLWNWEMLNEPPIVLSDHADWVWSATFSPNDDQLLVGINSSSSTSAKTNETIHAWPTEIESMSDLLCKYVTRNITKLEWDTYVSPDLKYEKTCSNFPANDK